MKKSLRNQARQRRREVHKKKGIEAAALLADNFFNNVKISDDDIVALYSPFGSELDIYPIAVKLQSSGVQMVLPCVLKEAAPLLFRRWHVGDNMVEGTFGIAEPVATTEAVKPTIMLVPLLAFDKHRHRIGYGRGYYDRTIKTITDVKTIEVGYAYMQLEQVPVEAHDVQLDMIITDDKVFT